MKKESVKSKEAILKRPHRDGLSLIKLVWVGGPRSLKSYNNLKVLT